MAENKENNETELLLTEEELSLKDSLLSTIEKRFSKNINMLLLTEHVLNYFTLIDNIDEMTADPDNFISLTQLEEQIKLLVQKSTKVASELVTYKVGKLDEEGIIKKKKNNT
ncbi:MAG: hypothetical protein LBF22_05510 [Deltaproteobacteria bacterium]|jgi:hypothetical protein|nr:hypothetical protein [Deltaproteobacteria bacterium]